ncbi:hypothetical protein GW17_00038367, partial [Ensete ventricosum]
MTWPTRLGSPRWGAASRGESTAPLPTETASPATIVRRPRERSLISRRHRTPAVSQVGSRGVPERNRASEGRKGPIVTRAHDDSFILLLGSRGVPARNRASLTDLFAGPTAADGPGSSSPRRPEGQTDRRSGRGPPRKRQPTQEVSIPTDVGGLAHSDENRSSRHLSSTPESSVTFLALEGGPMSQERPTSNPNTKHPGGSTHVFPSTLQPVGQAPRVPAEEASMILPTPNHYWRLFNDPGLAPLDPGL